ncbi:MAG TPA: glycosyl hydrolase family 18 protein [Candidatus Limnocylindrales bacterium]|nr:glycosyl hydrolase family 18 protein [Candidatus Limnocylindrales bacterium]
MAAILIAVPGAWPASAAAPVPAAAVQPAPALAPSGDAGLTASDSAPGDTTGGTAADGTPGSSDAGPNGPMEPSAQYLDSLTHAADHIDFQPGGRVSVPFRPRAGDTWPVDGGRPRALPAGRISGLQMRDDSGPTDPGQGAGANAASGASAASADSDAVAAGPAAPASTVATVSPTGLHKAVLGFLPYWEVSDSTTVLDYSTLSTVAYFSVGCGSSGTLLKKNSDGSTTTGWAGWTSSKMTSIINAAHTAGTRVAMTLSCFAWSSSGATLQAKILNTSSYRNALAAATAKAVHDRGADGVNLDFEPLVSGTEAGFVAFVRALRSALDGYAPGYELTFDTMGFIGNYPIADATASGAADALMIMGYDYRSTGTSYVGSISPLSGPPYDLNDTISSYTKYVSASKIILGLPYYGRAWSTDSSAIHAKNISGTKYGASVNVTYASAVGFAAQYGRKYDSIEQAPWTEYQKQTCTTTYGCVTSWRQLYYDDPQSLAARYDMINRRGLRGAGIWALGYDSTRPELRQLLADKFLRDTTAPVTGVATMPGVEVDEGFPVTWKAYDDTGVATYDVQVSRDGGAWSGWLTAATSTSMVYLGATGHTYAFRVRATDSLGNTSAWYDAAVTGLGTPSSLAAGTFARVTIDGLHMRASADTSASTMTTLAKGSLVYVTGGPKSADGYTWYRVNGPISQWSPVDFTQLGGWVAVTDGTSNYVVPRSSPYATQVSAGMTGYAVGGGGDRVVTPDGDGVNDTIRVDWTNTRALDSLTLRVFASSGSLVGSRSVTTKLAAGNQTLWWDGTLGGAPVAAGNYVLQLVGTRGTTTYTAPSSAPVSQAQLLTFGIAVGAVAPTSVFSFAPTTASPTRSTSIGYKLIFGGSVTGLTAADLSRSGTATGCVVGTPTGSGASYAVTVSKCSAGSVILTVKANAVRDAVGNTGPDAAVAASKVVIDRTAPTNSAPLTGLRSGITASTASVGSRLNWSGSDAGGAGIATYDVERSVDGATFKVIATGLTTASLAVTLAPGHTYRFAVRAHDRAGNVGGWKAGATTSSVVRQENASGFVYGSGWHTSTSSSYLGGAVRYASTAGAGMHYTFTGRAIAFVTTLAATRGQVKVYVDGTYLTTLDLSSATVRYRAVAWERRWSVSGTHTVRLVVVGTPGRPRVDVDAFVVLR